MKKLINSKIAETKALQLIIIAIIAILVYSVFLKPSTPTQSGVGTGNDISPPQNTVTLVSECSQGTTLSNFMKRRYTEASLTAENATVYANGAKIAVLGGNGGTTTIQSGLKAQSLDIYYAEDQSTTYYTQHAKGKVSDCTSSASTGEDRYFKLVTDLSPGGAPVVYSDAPNKPMFITDNVKIDITNDGQSNAQDGILNGGSNVENLSIGQGATGSVTLNFKVDYNEGWGTIGGNIIGCQFPSAVYDSTNPIVFTVGGETLQDAGVTIPSQIFPLIQANNTVKAWKFPGIDGRLKSAIPGSMIIKAGSNNDPAGALDRINCTVFDTDYYQKQVDGSLVLDIVNRDTNADLGGANTIFDFVIGVE